MSVSALGFRRFWWFGPAFAKASADPASADLGLRLWVFTVMPARQKVIFISGPRHSGKSTLIRFLARSLCHEPPHYLRLVPVNGQDGPRLTFLGDLKSAGLASWKRINYDAERIFEFLPECLAHIARMNQSPTVLLEADSDPNLRFAYPYDHRIFIMPVPKKVEDVFRTPDEAASALKEVMDDTAAFASEIYGLFDPDTDEDDTACHLGQGRTERVEITPTQMRRFVNSPLGTEVTSRIQLQPAYHSVVESDVILLNMAVGGSTAIADQVLRQVRTLLDRLGTDRMTRPVLFQCDPLNAADPRRNALLEKLRTLLS